MMECKKALSAPEVNGDIQIAKEWLRKHGSAKASSKVMGRDALEGLVGMQITGEGEDQVASLVKVASETDFASRSEMFSTFVQEVADAASASTDSKIGHDIPNFVATAKNHDGKLISERLNDVILSIRENLQVDSISLLKASSPNSVLMGYVHGRVSPTTTCGSAASLVELEVLKPDQSGITDTAREAAKKLAMHVVAAKPLYLNPASVPEDVVQTEKDTLMEKLEGSNKPPAIQEKIVVGQLRKFYEGICLTEQLHMAEEGNPKVSKYMKDLGLEVKGFSLMGMRPCFHQQCAGCLQYVPFPHRNQEIDVVRST